MFLDANYIRGRMGKKLREMDRCAYDRFFAPTRLDGPSGLRDAARPFVLRVREGPVAAGARFDFSVNLFDLDAPLERIACAFEPLFWEYSSDPVRFDLDPVSNISSVRVEFLTPTELKGAAKPEFGVLFARIRDRISTLRALYQGGPLEIDFKTMGERAGRVRMTKCEIQHVEAERTSRATGQTHSLGGFIGAAEYQGDLGEFFPYLAAAGWTGVGRQTVWGKGEIACECLDNVDE